MKHKILKEGLNKREKSILKYISKQIEKNGYPPSVREIGKAVGLSSTATVHGYLSRLEEKGYVKKENQKGRTLRLLKDENGENVTKKRKEEAKNFYTGRELVDVPVIGKITAGAPILAVENVTDTFPIPIDFVGNSESFMLTVRGESMIEAGILDGDYILIRKQNTAENGQIVVALIEDEEEIIVTREDGMYVVKGKSVERVMKRVNIEDNESLYYFQKSLEELGVNQKLKKMGVKEGDIVKILDYELEWED